jgi:hypothetical protein
MQLWREFVPRSLCRVDPPTGGTGGGTGGGGQSGGASPGAASGASAGGAPPPATAAGGAPWYETRDFAIDDATKQFIAGKNFPDIKTALRSGMEADKLARDRNVIERPNPEKLSEWKGWSELGWIEDAGKYTLKQPQLPNGVVYSGELMEKLRSTAHAQHVPLAAAQAIHDAVWSHLVDGVQKLDAEGARARTELETKLRADWGLDFNRNSELARRAAAAFNPMPEDTQVVGKIMGEPALVKMFHKIGEQIGEAHLPAGGAGALPPTVAATEAELNRLENDPGFMKVFKDNRHPQYRDFVAQRQRLIAHLARLQSRAA